MNDQLDEWWSETWDSSKFLSLRVSTSCRSINGSSVIPYCDAATVTGAVDINSMAGGFQSCMDGASSRQTPGLAKAPTSWRRHAILTLAHTSACSCRPLLIGSRWRMVSLWSDRGGCSSHDAGRQYGGRSSFPLSIAGDVCVCISPYCKSDPHPYFTQRHAPLWTGPRSYDLPSRCSVFTVAPSTIYASFPCATGLPYELRVGVFADLTGDDCWHPFYGRKGGCSCQWCTVADARQSLK